MGKIAPADIRHIDGLEDTSMSAEIVDSGAWTSPPAGYLVRVSANDHSWPRQSSCLTPVAARLLARHLLEFADEADLLNLEARDVEMACTVCGEPVRRSFAALAWEHREPSAAIACTATGPIKARVAAG